MPTEARGSKRQPRFSDRDEWTVSLNPEQRIVPQELWDAAKERQVEMSAVRDARLKLNGNPLPSAQRPGDLLSELVFRGPCEERFVATAMGVGVAGTIVVKFAPTARRRRMNSKRAC